jgi:hypothetical protein
MNPLYSDNRGAAIPSPTNDQLTNAVHPGLDDLEHTASVAHARIACLETGIAQFDRERLPLAMAAGDALIEIVERRLVRHGQRSALYIRTCGSVRVAQIYVNLAENRELVEAAKAKCVSHLGINAALKLIRQAKGTARATEPKPALDLTRVDNTALTAALLALGFDRLMTVLPPEFYPQLARRKTTVDINRLRARHPNLRVKRLRTSEVLDLIMSDPARESVQ